MRSPSHAVCVAAIVLSFSNGASAQIASHRPVAGDSAALVKLFPLAYPPLARQTRLDGEVDVVVKVTQDGTVQSATLVSGHPLLAPVALESARQSTFSCRGCGDVGSSVHLTFTFQLAHGNCCAPDSSEFPRLFTSANHVTVIDQATCICDPATAIIHVRSIKCLYLWKCGTIWLQ